MTQQPTIGFISAPAWFDPAPAEFPGVCVDAVRTQQAPLLLPDFDYRLESIAGVQKDLNLCAESLAAMGCDLVAQVGSPFAWAGAASEADARARNAAMADAAGVPSIMTGLALVDGLRAVGAKKVAANCTYYDPDWRDAFGRFMQLCGFDTIHISNLADQGLADPSMKIEDYGWSMTPELARQSIRAVADAAPQADAIAVTGAGTRTLSILAEMEEKTQKPIIAADTIVYWAVARALNLTLRPELGLLASVHQ